MLVHSLGLLSLYVSKCIHPAKPRIRLSGEIASVGLPVRLPLTDPNVTCVWPLGLL